MKNSTTLAILLQAALIAPIYGQGYTNTAPDNHTVPSGCTVITIAKGDRIFFAGNDDYINPDSYYWVEPGDSSTFGVIWIGKPDNPQQGINEKGLGYDSNGLPQFKVNPHTERIPFEGEYYHNYIMQIMHECSTVAEVIEWVRTHQRFPYMHDQLHFADRTGDAVIISAGKDGEMVFTRKVKGDGFLVSTNFNVVNPANGFTYPCWRFDKAGEMLSLLVSQNEPLKYRDVVNVMDAVHVEKPSWTVETMVADLGNGVIYLYYFYQFDRPIVINVMEELLNPREAGPLSMLFPGDVRQEAAKRFDKANAATTMIKSVAVGWLILVVLSTALFFIVCTDRKSRRIWLPSIFVLGPIALIFLCLALKRERETNGSKALVESIMDTVPIVISYTIAFTVLVVSSFPGSVSPWIQISMILVLPIVLGAFVHMGFLYPNNSMSLGKFFQRRIAHVIVTTFLGLGGISSVAMPLINNNISVSLIIPLSPLAVIGWWAMVAAGAVIGGFFIFLLEYWAISKGYTAWNTLADKEEKVSTAGWSKLWWWLPISMIIMLIGLTLGVNFSG